MKNNIAKALVEHYCEAKHYSQSFVEAFEVWHCYILGNEKWLFGVILDGYSSDFYFEVTYNKEKEEIYIDEYKKSANMCVSDKVYNTYETIRKQLNIEITPET